MLLALSTTVMMLAPVAADANGIFIDDDDSVFEADIEWLAAAGITQGCKPPANDRICTID